MNKNVILIAVIVLALGAVAYGVVNRTGGGAALAPVELEGLDDQQTLVRMAQGISMGSDDAPVTILEFADFQCPACMGFAGSVKPQLEAAWVETGQARYVYYDFPLISIHPHAFLAARAGRCANDQERFWPYHDALYRNQSVWARSTNPPVRDFERYAAEVGLDQDAFSACLRSDQHAEVVTANMRLGEELGVTGTPTVMVNGGGVTRRIGENSFAALQTAVEALLPAPAAPEGGDGGTP